MKQLKLFKGKDEKYSSLKAGCPGTKCRRWEQCIDQVIESNKKSGRVNEPDRLDKIWGLVDLIKLGIRE